MTIMKAKPRGKSQILSRKRTAQLLKTNKKLVTVVAKRKQSETALLDSETRYRRLFESAQDGILILDAETGQITDINPFLIKMLGYSYKEFLGKKLWEIGLFKDIVSSRASFKELQTKGYIRYENLPLETKDGRKMAVEFVSNVYLVDHSKVIQCNIRDITDRKKIENGLEKARKELAVTKISEDAAREYAESIINTVRKPLIVLDQDLRVISANRSFYDIFKVKPKETVGQLIYNLGNKQWDIPKLRELLETILPKKTAFDDYKVEHDFSTIGRRIMLLNARQIKRVLGKERIILLAIEDITERKIAQEALQKAHSELELKVNQRTAELRQSNIKLVQEIEERKKAEEELLNTRRLSDIGTLAATVAHELRNPLAAIRMAAYNIKRKAKNPELDKNLENIEIKINDSEKIISNLLFYSRLKKAVFEQVDIYKTLEEYLVNAKAQYSKQSLKIQKQMEAIKGITIEADRLQMQELFGNILNNAYEASPETGGEIEVVGSVHGTNFIKITIKDNGIGIDENDLKRLFEPFFSTKAKGTGLGLTVCYQIVKLHNGNIDVQSKKGEGTSMSVVLPIKRKENV